MKVLLLTLLLLLCSTQVLTLTCYTCNGDSDSDSDCKMETNCPLASQYCKTTVEGDRVSRSCEETCVEDDFTTCCNQDGC